MRDYSDEEFAEFIANSAPIPLEDGTLTGDRNCGSRLNEIKCERERQKGIISQDILTTQTSQWRNFV